MLFSSDIIILDLIIHSDLSILYYDILLNKSELIRYLSGSIIKILINLQWWQSGVQMNTDMYFLGWICLNLKALLFQRNWRLKISTI